MSLITTLKNFMLYISVVLILLGLILPVTRGPSQPSDLYMIIGGLVLSFLSLFMAVIVTKQESKDSDIDDLIFHNSLTYVIIVGNIFLIGYLLQPLDPYTEAMIMDLALIMGLFIVLMFIWIMLKQKLGFLDADINIDFASSSDKEKIPTFLITSLVLGGIFAGLYLIFKLIYTFAGFGITAIIFIVIIFVFVFTISLTLHILKKD